MDGEGEDLGLLGGESGDSAGVAEEELPGGGEGGEEISEGEAEGAEEDRAQETEEGERRPAGAAERALPVQLRQALRELTTANPDFAKRFPRLERQLTSALFRDQQYTRMGGMQQLRAANELLQAHGGAEGIRGLAEEAEASRVMEDGCRNGDPVFVRTWAEEYPQGFKASVGPAIAQLESMDLPAHDRALSGPIYKTMDRCGVLASMQDLETAIAGERFEDISKHFGALKNFFIELRRFSERAQAPDPLKGQRELLDQDRQSIQSERRESFRTTVASAVEMNVTGQTNRLLREALAGRKVQASTMVRIRKQINEDLARAVNTAPGYSDRYKAVMGAGDHNRSVQFITQAARQKLPDIVKGVLRDFNLGAAPSAPRRSAAGPRASAGSQTVSGRPKTADVDFRRTDKTAWLGSLTLGHGEAYLKDGRRAKW